MLTTFSLEMYFTAFAAVIGLCVGSFLNVCAFRWAAGELSVVRPRSFCPSCKENIRWHDNVPVFSFLFLRGRCRSCGWRIPLHYPFVELAAGFTFVGFYLLDGWSPAFAFHTFFVCLLIISTVTDFQLRIIPDEVSFYGILFGLLMSYTFPSLQGESDHRLAIADSILGVLIGGGVLYAVAVFGDWYYKQESMGGGDIKLLAMIGAFLGPANTLMGMVYASFIGAAVGLCIMLITKNKTIAFGPYLAAGAVVALFFGLTPLNWFTHLVFGSSVGG